MKTHRIVITTAAVVGVALAVGIPASRALDNPADEKESKSSESSDSGEKEKSDGAAWVTDYEKALARAKEEKKVALLDFTGSDWCGWCIKLKKEVFDKKEFKEFAAENLVLVELDFPRDKEQSKEVVKQNKKLQKKFGIKGYPTIILVDADGKEIARTGYQKGGPEAYVEHLKELIAKAK